MWFGRSVMNMCPGLWVIMNAGFEASATACGVTPQAVALASKPAFMVTHSPGHMFITDVPNSTLAAF